MAVGPDFGRTKADSRGNNSEALSLKKVKKNYSARPEKTKAALILRWKNS